MLGQNRDPLCVAIDVIVVRLGTKKIDIAVGSAQELGRWQKGLLSNFSAAGSLVFPQSPFIGRLGGGRVTRSSAAVEPREAYLYLCC